MSLHGLRLFSSVMLTTLLFFGFALALSACPQAPLTPLGDADADVVVTTVAEAGVVDSAPVASDQCAQACANLRKLGCPEGSSVDGGDSCERVCGVTYVGVFNIKPACVASASSVAGVRACGTVRCSGK